MSLVRWVRRETDQGHGVHPTWVELLGVLHSAGLCDELSADSLEARLGGAVLEPPVVETASLLLRSYYRGDGCLETGLRRLRFDRYIGRAFGAPLSAQDVVAWLALISPGLEPLMLVNEGATSVNMCMRTYNARSSTIASSARTFPGGLLDVVSGHSTSMQSLIVATNELLAIRGLTYRYLPLASGTHLEAYLGIEPIDAALMDMIHAFAAPLESLGAFAQWSMPLPPQQQVA